MSPIWIFIFDTVLAQIYGAPHSELNYKESQTKIKVKLVAFEAGKRVCAGDIP
jgi:hypothetical protein